MAGSISRPCSPTAAVAKPGDCREGPLSGSVANSQSRPLAVIPSARKSPRQRLVSKYSRHRPPTSTRWCSFSKKWSHTVSRRRSASDAGCTSAAQSGELALPTLSGRRCVAKQPVTDLASLVEAVTLCTSRASSEELRSQESACGTVNIFIPTTPFRRNDR